MSFTKVLRFATFFLFSAFSGGAMAQGLPSITAEEFITKSAAKPGVILDVRTDWEYKEGFVSNAINMDVNSDDFDQKVAKLDRNKTYYVYCAVGGRSAEAVRRMQSMGFKEAYNINGGIRALKAAKAKIVKK